MQCHEGTMNRALLSAFVVRKCNYRMLSLHRTFLSIWSAHHRNTACSVCSFHLLSHCTSLCNGTQQENTSWPSPNLNLHLRERLHNQLLAMCFWVNLSISRQRRIRWWRGRGLWSEWCKRWWFYRIKFTLEWTCSQILYLKVLKE